jgi:hypothetical protein
MTFVREENITILEEQPAILDLETGRYEEQEEKEIILRGNIQPVTGDDLKKLSEGIRNSDVKTLFLHVQLEQNWTILHKGKRYVVEHEDDWDSASATIRHYKYIIMLEGEVQ